MSFTTKGARTTPFTEEELQAHRAREAQIPHFFSSQNPNTGSISDRNTSSFDKDCASCHGERGCCNSFSAAVSLKLSEGDSAAKIRDKDDKAAPVVHPSENRDFLIK